MFRQFPGVTQITKMVHTPTNIVVSQQGSVAPSHYTLPAQCRVYLSCPGTNYSPHYWPSPLEVDPHRWDEVRHTNENSSDSSGSTHSKNVVAADRARQMRGTFLTFSDGQRSCLGRKFAQAEYVAFLATLLRDYKVVLGKGEDPKRVAQDVYLRSAGKITLAPLDSVKLELEKRTR
jgi:cytochrome P450